MGWLLQGFQVVILSRQRGEGRTSGRGMTWLVKSLRCKPKDLSLIPRIHVQPKRGECSECTCNPSTRGADRQASWGSLVSQPSLVSKTRANCRSCLKEKQLNSPWRRVLKVVLRFPHARTCTHVHTCPPPSLSAHTKRTVRTSHGGVGETEGEQLRLQP